MIFRRLKRIAIFELVLGFIGCVILFFINIPFAVGATVSVILAFLPIYALGEIGEILIVLNDKIDNLDAKTSKMEEKLKILVPDVRIQSPDSHSYKASSDKRPPLLERLKS